MLKTQDPLIICIKILQVDFIYYRFHCWEIPCHCGFVCRSNMNQIVQERTKEKQKKGYNKNGWLKLIKRFSKIHRETEKKEEKKETKKQKYEHWTPLKCMWNLWLNTKNATQKDRRERTIFVSFWNSGKERLNGIEIFEAESLVNSSEIFTSLLHSSILVTIA